MNVFYNPQGVGDVLIIPLEKGSLYDIEHNTIGDITRITNKNGDILGYNIFQASTHFDLTETGKITLSETLLNDVRQLFDQNKLNDVLDVDLRPKFVVGNIISKSPHENADKLSVCQVDVSDEVLQIVCGAKNVDKGQKVVVAKIGAQMPSGLKIKPTELRGVPSNGMICSRTELDLPDKPEEQGIYILDDTYEVGVPFTV